MAVVIGADEVRRMRARAQGLHGGAGATVEDAVRLSAGLQAQDVRACRLQVRARASGPTAGDVDAAVAGRSVVRTWLMRGTLHAVAARDVRWLTALLGPRAADSYRGRRRQLGLDDDVLGRALPALEKALAGTALTRDELVARLAAAGVVLDPRGQAPAHLLLYAAARGLVCRGAESAGDTATYVLAEEWLAAVPDPGLTGDEALAELAVRHATAYGPVSAADFARWSGLPLGRARRGHAAAGARLVQVTGPGGAPLVAAPGTGADTAAEPPQYRLTGHFDPYLLGYADRDLLLPPSLAPRIATGGGFLMPCVLRDGAVVGTWRHARRGPVPALRVEPLTGPPPPALDEALDAEAADLSRFLGTPVAWEYGRV